MDPTDTTDNNDVTIPLATDDDNSAMLAAMQDAFVPAEPAGDADAPPVADAPLAGEPDPADAKPAEPAEPANPDAKPDAKPEDDEIGLPEGVKEKTRERFEQLTTQKKEIEAKHAEVTAERDGFKQRVQEWNETLAGTGATPEQFGGAMLYLKELNSGTRAGAENAYNMMLGELQTLAKVLGKEAPGFDPLSVHPDLQERVDSALLDRASALELASHRQGKQIETVTMQRQREAMEAQNAKVQGGESIKQVAAQLRQSDPHYASKAPMFEAIISTILEGGIPPSQWADRFARAYQAIPVPAAPAAVAAAPRLPTTVPDAIRSGGAASTTTAPEPKSLEEAMSAAWR